MFSLPLKIYLDPDEAEIRRGWGGKEGAPKENTVQSVASSRHHRNLNIPRTGAGMGTTGGVVTGVRARQRSTVETQRGQSPFCVNVNMIRISKNSCLVLKIL